jgi:hypothetical protein
MELPDTDLKIDAPGKGRHFQKDFFYRLDRLLNLSKVLMSKVGIRINFQALHVDWYLPVNAFRKDDE